MARSGGTGPLATICSPRKEPTVDLTSRFATCYDLDQGAFTDDIPFYQALAQRAGSPILELGCGTGRLVLALADAGYHVCGIDHSSAMLNRARERVERAGPRVARRIRLVQADLRQLAMGEQFSLAILAINTLMHIDDAREQAAVLEMAFQHLAPGGLLALDLFHPHPAALAPGDGEMLLDDVLVDPSTGHTVLKFVARRVDYARQLIQVTFVYDEVDEQGQLRRTTETFPMRYLHRGEADQMLRQAGFVIEQVYGSYDLDPYQDGGDRMLFLAGRPQEAPSC